MSSSCLTFLSHRSLRPAHSIKLDFDAAMRVRTFLASLLLAAVEAADFDVLDYVDPLIGTVNGGKGKRSDGS